MTWIDCDERCRVCSKRLELLLGPDTYGINKATYRCLNCGPGRPARDVNGPAQIRAAVAAVLAQWCEADWQKEIAMIEWTAEGEDRPRCGAPRGSGSQTLCELPPDHLVGRLPDEPVREHNHTGRSRSGRWYSWAPVSRRRTPMTHEDPNCFRCCDTGRADVPADDGEGVPCPDCTPADGDTSMVVLVGGWS